jgi:SEC-C motif
MEESLPLVLNWLRQGEEFIDFWTYESPIDILFDSFYPIAKNHLPNLLAYIKEPNQCNGTRSLVATVAEKVALEEEGRRAEAVAWFREVAQHTVANVEDDDLIDTNFLMTWILSVIDIKGTELWPEVQELYELNLIPWEAAGELKQIEKYIFENPRVQDTVGNYSMSIVRSYGKGTTSEEIDLSQRIKDALVFPKMEIIQDYHTELYRNIAPYNKLTKSVKPVPKPQNKTARNAPCPCGSGKKFKRCHG